MSHSTANVIWRWMVVFEVSFERLQDLWLGQSLVYKASGSPHTTTPHRLHCVARKNREYHDHLYVFDPSKSITVYMSLRVRISTILVSDRSETKMAFTVTEAG